MAGKKKPSAKSEKHPRKRPIEQYDHKSKTRINNPPVGLVTPQTDPVAPSRKSYDYDPHLDPQLVWAGKKEHASFEIPTVSLHVHERIDPATIIEAVRKRNGAPLRPAQGYLFESREENPPLREAVDFYRHSHGWTNRLIAGDSLLVMNSLIEKEGMAGQVQMVYIDPPYGIDYGSNFQPFIGNRTVKDRDSDLTQEPEMVKAFRDAWELGIHSYLTFLRDRITLAMELLRPSGSIFVQIGDQNLHLVRQILDEVVGPKNCGAQIIFRKKMMPLSKKAGFESMNDYILWYVKSKPEAEKKLHQIFKAQNAEGNDSWNLVETPDGNRRGLTKEEISNHDLLPKGSRVYSTISMKPREYREGQDFNFEFLDNVYPPPGGKVRSTPDGKHCWSTTADGMKRLASANRLQVSGDTLRYVLFHEDYPVVKLTGLWADTAPANDMRYVVETNPQVVQRCLLAATDPGDIVFDPTCGSGTTAFVAEQWGRRWITCDTSRVATTLAKQRLMGAAFDYYKLAHPNEGVDSGFQYEKVPHVTLGSIAQDEPTSEETLYDRPLIDNSRARISGPFTVEAVPAPNVKSIDVLDSPPRPADASIARSGPTLRQSDWRDELLKTGIRGKGGQMINFSRVEPLGGTRWIHADAETKGTKPERVVICFGPDYAPLEQRVVEMAWEEARTLHPKPGILVFAAFQFDAEAAKDIDELTKEKTGMTFLTAQMNADLLTDDLKKKRSSNQSFWLVGRPDVEIIQVKAGEHKGKYQAKVHGFDYYDTRSGTIVSGDTRNIAMWLLDTDYDGRSLYPRQVFFPLADEDEGWVKLAKNLKAEIDPDLIEAYRGIESLPFESGEHKRVAVKVIDDRGIESLKVIPL